MANFYMANVVCGRDTGATYEHRAVAPRGAPPRGPLCELGLQRFALIELLDDAAEACGGPCDVLGRPPSRRCCMVLSNG
jgi:hypothetical protein